MASLSFYRGDNREIVNSRASLHQLSVMKPVGRFDILYWIYEFLKEIFDRRIHTECQ